jgi:GNAT superfamily N-acetyltransferase
VSGFRISTAVPTEPAALELIRELNSELYQRYPEPGATHFRLEPEEVRPGRGAFLIATDDETGESLGCAAVRVLEPGLAEIKRMYVRPHSRGRRLGHGLLAALEGRAVALGVRRLVLETGTRQNEALRLYQRAGFIEIPRFGEYLDSPLSVCMAKTLDG